MSERLAACQALAAMIKQHGEPTEEEVTFVGMAALQLGLTADESQQVQTTLKQGGDFAGFLCQIDSKAMRTFLLRRMLAATLLDEQINDGEQVLLKQAAKQFELNEQRLPDLIAWMKVSIDVEKRLTALLADI